MTSLEHVPEEVDDFLALYPTPATGDRVTPKLVLDFTREAVRLSSMARGERELLAATRRHPDIDR
jgi:hypothetical protein